MPAMSLINNKKSNLVNHSLFLILFLLVASIHATAEEITNKANLESEAMGIVKKFAGSLKPQLKKAIQSGGLEQAVNICSVEAPKIARELSEQTDWNIKRVSLKPRNNNAVPNDSEEKILQQFNQRQIQGESPSTITYSEITNNKFRFMKAQSVEAICLNCHGKSVAPNVKNVIKQHYPEDSAMGYSLGQIRGAFSLVKNL